MSLATINNKFVEGEFDGYSSFLAPRFGAGVVYKQRGNVRQFDDPAHGQYFDQLFGEVTEIDAHIFYRRDQWYYQIAASNLANTKYYSPVDNSFGAAVSVNPPRQVYGKVSYGFGKK